MIKVEEALEIINTHLPDWGEVSASVDQAQEAISLEALRADRDYPPFDRVMMDGIALKFESYDRGLREFKVEGVCPAGAPAENLLGADSCLEVMTGAPLPSGCDLVIPYEHLTILSGIATIREDQKRLRMDNVHLKGSDCKEGEVLLHRGVTLNGPRWGIAASIGKSTVRVQRKPKILIVSTGDELVEISQTPKAHQLRRSNAYALKASLQAHGYEEITLAHLPDEVELIEKHYHENASFHDLMIYSGGVSKGKFDYLPETWEKLGVRRLFHGVSQRPGKPLWFGRDEKNNTIVLGLPGNPVSSLVCLHRYLLSKREIYAQLSEEIIFKKDLTYFVPVKISFEKTGTLKAVPLKIQNSGEFTALAESDGFLELPREKTVFAAGESYLFHPWSRW